MKIVEAKDHIIAIFTIREKETGLIDHLEEKLSIFETHYSDDKLTWKVANRNIKKFMTLVKKFEANNSQMSLF